MLLYIDIPLHMKIKRVTFSWLHHYVLYADGCSSAISEVQI